MKSRRENKIMSIRVNVQGVTIQQQQILPSLPPATAAVVTAVAACHQSRHRPLRLSILRPNNQLQPAVHTAAWYEQNLPQTAASQSTYKLI